MQSSELDISKLLGVSHGLVVITKIDSVDGELLELVRADAEELIAGSFLEHAPLVAVSARSGAGRTLERSRNLPVPSLRKSTRAGLPPLPAVPTTRSSQPSLS